MEQREDWSRDQRAVRGSRRGSGKACKHLHMDDLCSLKFTTSSGYLKLVLTKMVWSVPEMLILRMLTTEITSCIILICVI